MIRVLIADDDPVWRRTLRQAVGQMGYRVEVVHDGLEAWRALRGDDAPPLAVLNWEMPGMDGVEVCQRVRELSVDCVTYTILLTAKDAKEDVVSGLLAGADDYITKPFHLDEFRARIQVGERIIGLQSQLARRVADLEESLSQVKRLHGLLPICTYCKKIRNDKDYWQAVESYITQHTEAHFSHGICPDCRVRHVQPLLETLPSP